MNLGTVIRKARRANDYTQEELAELLGVTVSAVSQWEQNRTLPDISLVPGICSVLKLSADELFGTDPASKEEKIEEILAEAERMEDREESPRAVLALLEEALTQYPDSMKLVGQTAYVLGVLSHSGEESPDDRRAFADRAASMHEKILARSDDENLRGTARQSLVYYYADRGSFDRALELAGTFDTCYSAREELEFQIYWKMRDFGMFQHHKQFFLSRAIEKIPFLCRGENGMPVYSEEETARLYEKQIAVCEILYDGDYLLTNGTMCTAHSHLAEYHASRGETEKGLYHLIKAADHAEALHEYLSPLVIDRHTVMNGEEVERFTCLLFRGGRDAAVGGGGRRDAQALLDLMADPVFDPVREREEFLAAREKTEAILK